MNINAKPDDEYGHTMNIDWGALDKRLRESPHQRIVRWKNRARQLRYASGVAQQAARNGGSYNG
jgi:hypothetical protein